jgi:hypothetical protein
MKCWYFRFEGRFRDGDPIYQCKGVFSSCMIPEETCKKAKLVFLQVLNENRVDLLNIIECFDVDEKGIDPKDSDNTFWIEWCQESIKTRKPVFDKWHVFDEQ